MSPTMNAAAPSTDLRAALRSLHYGLHVLTAGRGNEALSLAATGWSYGG